MKIIILFLIGSVCNAYNLDEFIYALESVESNHQANAIGRLGEVGILQISQIMVKDYNRITGEGLRHEDCFDPNVSRKICKSILIHYAPKNVNAKHLAFIWNAGGSAWRRVESPKEDLKQINLEKYYIRVLTELRK